MGVGQGEEEHKTSKNSRKFWISLGHLFSLSIHPPTHTRTHFPSSLPTSQRPHARAEGQRGRLSQVLRNSAQISPGQRPARPVQRTKG